MGRQSDPITILRRGIRLARRIEKEAETSPVRRPVRLVTYGFLVRNRRLAIAVERVGTDCAYEGRLLLRAMVETLINHAWIRLRQTHSRATRFVAYQPLELLRVHPSLHATMTEEAFKTARRNLVKQRADVRHLFRNRNNKGKLSWARNWAKVGTVEGRLDEVQRAENPAGPDPFLYGIYSWFSSVTHGGASSINDLFQKVNGRLVVGEQPEGNPKGHIVAAAAVLGFTLEAAVEDLGLKEGLSWKVDRYSRAVKGLGRTKQAA